MKKIILSLIIVVSCLTTSIIEVEAQTNHIPVKYQGELLVGFNLGVGAVGIDRVNIHTIQGVKIGDYFSTGLGVGINYIPSYTFDYGKPELYLPLYLNLKGHLPVNSKTSLFASFDIGGSFGLTEGVSELSGLLFTPSIGVSLNNKFNISFGYDLQKLSTGISGISVNMDAVTVRLSYIF